MESIFNRIHNCVADDIKNAFYHIHTLFNNTRKKYLEKFASEILLNGPLVRADLINFQYYSFTIDGINTKLYKSEQTKLK